MEESFIQKIKPHFSLIKKLSPVKLIALSFIGLILIGSLLLYLPVSCKTETSYLNHLFIATSASCVTGLVTVTPCEQYTVFGQIILLFLIQIGGLGFLTLLMIFYSVVDQRLNLSSKMMLQQALNINTLNGISKYLYKIIQYTLIMEGSGWVLLTIAFSRYYSFGKALWYGLFHSISAFCNAGFDLLGNSSLIAFQYDVAINLIICALIIMGGLGFIVHLDIENKVKREYKSYKQSEFKYHFSFKRFIGSLALHTKIVLIMTLVLTLGGMIGFWVLEANNTLAGESIFHQMLLSFFQSVTLRTAGFSTMDYASLKDATKLFMCIFMMIGGSPAGTAGGLKSVTIFIVFMSFIHYLKNSKENVVFNFAIKDEDQRVAGNLFFLGVLCITVMVMLLSLVDDHAFIDIVFEIFSAFGTVGITAGITSTLSNAGKILIIILMYAGRIGPATLVLSFITTKRKNADITHPSGNILIG